MSLWLLVKKIYIVYLTKQEEMVLHYSVPILPRRNCLFCKCNLYKGKRLDGSKKFWRISKSTRWHLWGHGKILTSSQQGVCCDCKDIDVSQFDIECERREVEISSDFESLLGSTTSLNKALTGKRAQNVINPNELSPSQYKKLTGVSREKVNDVCMYFKRNVAFILNVL